jgi:hypothetical protein
MVDNGPDDIERLIEKALASYAAAEPRPGLDARVMARVRVEGRVHRWWRWAWPVAAAATAVLWFVLAPRPARHTAPPLVARSAEGVPAHPPVRAKLQPARRAARARVAAVTKRSQFPTPYPPTAEERALLAWATRNPDLVRELAQQLRRTEEPIRIEPIQIEPLEDNQVKEQQ